MQPKHSAIVAGLTLTLSFGAVSAPAPAAAEEPTPGVASDATDIDKGLYTQQSFSGVLRSVQGVSFVNVTPEMKYFTKYESHGNYNQGFSYGDGYNALGYYQFDRRWSLIPFMKQVYNYSPEKYSMLKDAIDRGSEISNTSNAMYENGQLTELGRIAQEAFQGAYNTDPVEFSALQDAYAYNSYYAVTEAWLKSGLGIDISGRADCVKGMVWSITNMCGTGGCRDFFRWANLSNDMSDREFVTALSYSVVNNVATKYSSQPQYHEGWKNRYRNELKDCLVYIAEDEAAAAATPVQPEPTPAPSPTPDSNDGSSDDANDDRMDAPSTDADGNGSAGGAINDGSTSNGSNSNGSAAGDSSSSSAGNTDSDASGSTGADTSNSSTGSSDSSVDTGSNNGSGSDATPDSDASKDDSNKAPDAPVASPDKKPSFSEQLGSTLGSSLMAGVNNGSAQNKDNSDQASTEKTEAAKGDSKDKASEKTESDKGSSSEEKDKDKKSESEEKDKSKTEGEKQQGEDEKKQSEDDDKSGADNQSQEQNGSKTVTTTTTTTTTTKSSGGNMPKTGDLIVMASLASASLATLGATSIVSGKHKLDQQKKAAGQNDSEE
ncbi:hypothetical protein PMX26_07995 [Collinsella aerofaciens]|uniref:hypothetical protein n=1 Tax=Collinsella aerofaciens TaxID=74426 RepID=UPI00189B4074|nr:hypothetical protein [Collinsella aerofaciens]MDB1866365.1 hypothetical protein [Collinsella aerofaciens]MDB1870247.1 hypothetical protein [Collinsella aerofaciens]MDB1874216.1 hypothetical protein [Collinsella aerofaciens]